MWVLMLMLMIHGERHYYQIDTFATLLACEDARELTENGMHQSYPEDHQFTMFCKQRAI